MIAISVNGSRMMKSRPLPAMKLDDLIKGCLPMMNDSVNVKSTPLSESAVLNTISADNASGPT